MAAIAILALCAVVISVLEPAPEPLSGHLSASDGDSFHWGRDRVRLLGIDAPELEQSCRNADGAAWPCGQLARDRLAHLLKGTMACTRHGQDRFGRALATCSSDARDIAATLVRAGWAISTQGYDREQAAARSARLGIWVGPFQTPHVWREENPRP